MAGLCLPVYVRAHAHTLALAHKCAQRCHTCFLETPFHWQTLKYHHYCRIKMSMRSLRKRLGHWQEYLCLTFWVGLERGDRFLSSLSQFFLNFVPHLTFVKIRFFILKNTPKYECSYQFDMECTFTVCWSWPFDLKISYFHSMSTSLLITEITE